MESVRLTVSEKELILKLQEDGLSCLKIAKVLEKHRFTIATFLKRENLKDSRESKENRGRLRLTDSRTDRRLIQIVKNNRRKPLEELRIKFNELNCVKLSTSTVKRRLKEFRYKRRVVKKKIVISKANRIARRAWCRSRLHKTVDQYWKKVIFSDETQVVLGKDRKVYVWRKDEEQYDPACLGTHGDPTPRVQARVMFWGCISYSGVGTLVDVNGNINSQMYVEILDQNLWPVVAKDFSDKPWIFQDDNCPVHNSRYTLQWKRENSIPSLLWPSQSPDLNIIENVWRKMKSALNRRTQEVNCRADLVRVVQEIWVSLSPAYIQSLYNSIPTRIRHVYRANGCISRW